MPPAFGFQSGRRWRRRGVLHPLGAQPGVCAVHVAHDDGHVLEPSVVAPRVGGHRSPARREVLGELEHLVAEPHAHHAHAEPDDALQALPVGTPDLDVDTFSKSSTRE